MLMTTLEREMARRTSSSSRMLQGGVAVGAIVKQQSAGRLAAAGLAALPHAAWCGSSRAHVRAWQPLFTMLQLHTARQAGRAKRQEAWATQSAMLATAGHCRAAGSVAGAGSGGTLLATATSRPACKSAASGRFHMGCRRRQPQQAAAAAAAPPPAARQQQARTLPPPHLKSGIMTTWPRSPMTRRCCTSVSSQR